MSKELIERLRVFAGDPVLGGVIEEATDRIEQLETELKTERRLSFRNQVAELEAERDQLRNDVKMLRKHGAAASESLGRFVSDEGWGQADMDNMDSLDAALAATEPKP